MFSSTPTSILTVYLSVFIDAFGGLVAMPVIPFIVFEVGGTSRDIGFLTAAYQFTSIFSMPLTSWASDNYGRRPFFLLGFIGSLAGFLVIAFSTDIWQIILGRAIGGAFGASMPIAQAYITDVAGRTEVAGQFRAQLGSVFMAALIFAPGFGGGLAGFSLQAPFFVSACLALGGFILGYFYIVEPSKNNTMGETEEREKPDPDAEKAEPLVETEESKQQKALEEELEKKEEAATIIENRNFVRLTLVSSFIANFGFRITITMLAVWVQYKFDWASREFGFMASGIGIVGIGGNLILYGKMIKAYGLMKSAMMSSFIVTVGWVIVSLSQTTNGTDASFFAGPFVYIIGMVVVTMFNSIFSTATKTTLAKYATKTTQGKVMGTSESFNAVGGVIAPLVAGELFEQGFEDVLPLCTALAYFLCFIVVTILYRMESKKSAACGSNKKDDEVPTKRMVEFDTMQHELIYLKARVHELEIENELFKRNRRGSVLSDEKEDALGEGMRFNQRSHFATALTATDTMQSSRNLTMI